jgi:hypothetical protein
MYKLSIKPDLACHDETLSKGTTWREATLYHQHIDT